MIWTDLLNVIKSYLSQALLYTRMCALYVFLEVYLTETFHNLNNQSYKGDTIGTSLVYDSVTLRDVFVFTVKTKGL